MLRVNLKVLHVDIKKQLVNIKKWHFNIIMLHVYTVYLACEGQRSLIGTKNLQIFFSKLSQIQKMALIVIILASF